MQGIGVKIGEKQNKLVKIICGSKKNSRNSGYWQTTAAREIQE